MLPRTPEVAGPAGGMGVAATTLTIPLPMPPLRQN
jgi:hypothetical protein